MGLGRPLRAAFGIVRAQIVEALEPLHPLKRRFIGAAKRAIGGAKIGMRTDRPGGFGDLRRLAHAAGGGEAPHIGHARRYRVRVELMRDARALDGFLVVAGGGRRVAQRQGNHGAAPPAGFGIQGAHAGGMR